MKHQHLILAATVAAAALAGPANADQLDDIIANKTLRKVYKKIGFVAK